MGDAVLCILIIGGFFILRAVFATIFFFCLLPEGDRCLNCDAVTVRVESKFWGFFLRRFRPSWCMVCGWEGLLRAGPLTPTQETSELTKHPSA